MLRSFILLIFTTLILSSNSQCTAQQQSLDYIITGVAELGSPTVSTAQEDFSVIFPRTQSLGTYNNIFSAFSVIGLQSSSGQNFYSIIVDQVVFSNDNTVMRFIMDYFNNQRTVKTTWTKVKLAYIVVSPQFEGLNSGSLTGVGNSYVFAKGIGYNVANGGSITNQPVDVDPIFNNPNTGGYCGFIQLTSLSKVFGTDCPVDAKILYHYYIMGFRYDSTSDSAYEFRVSVKGGTGTNPNQNSFSAVIQSGVVPNGPRFTIDSFGGNLKYIKIGIVLTVLREYNTYPANGANSQLFKYSGVFMPVSLYNSPIAITTSATQNLNRFDIGYNKYVMYGFSSISVIPNTYLDFSLQVQNLYQLQLTSQNLLNDVIVSADFYSSVIDAACLSTLIQKTSVASEQYSLVPSSTAQQQTLQKVASSLGILTDAANQYVFQINSFNYLSQTDAISMTITLAYVGLTPGQAYVIETAFDELSATDIPSGWVIKYTLSIDNAILLTDTINTDNSQNDKINKIGRNIATSSATFVINIAFNRNPNFPVNFKFNFALLEVDKVYDSILQCCSTKCSAGTGLNVKTTPFTCISCNSSAGQFYNSATAQCQCSPGYFLVSSVSQICTPCTARLCSACNPSVPSLCQTCVAGASLQFTGQCTCNTGLVATNNTCSSCPTKCNGCDSSGKCLACIDSKRDINKNCDCTDGFYDNGGSSCIACNSSCKTCSSSNVCTSCDATQNKRLQGGLCICNAGYYSTVDNQGNLQCQKCASQCEECVNNAWTCTFCDPSKNKISGYDSSGRLTCLCASGYNLGPDGSCSQTDCTKDPYCLQCSTDSLRICLACKTSINRVLDQSTYTCVCKQGYYPSPTGQCIICPSGCATCSSGSTCLTCVAGATRVGSTCSCPAGTFFVDTPTRYCKACQDSCVQCNSVGGCIQCLSSYQLTTDGRCICGAGKFTNANGECTSCLSATCATCRNATICLTCISGYVLQQGQCISSCSQGYYRNGSVCLSCPSGCSLCSSSGTCQACNANLNLFNGKCYQTCPLGTLTDQSTGRCTSCNSPCRTCLTHPSVCTSCQTNSILTDGKCLTNCSPGTYPSNGICQPCDFSCATCQTSPRLCTSCTDIQFLYNGDCYDYCPKFDSNGRCVASCSPGYYQSSSSACSPCPSNCQQCSTNTQCTKCASNLYSYLGSCLNSCPSNTFVSQDNNCVACDVSCQACQSTPTQCIKCSNGYNFNSRTKTCTKSSTTPICTSRQFLNKDINQCENCSSQCATCSDRNQCLTCPNGSPPIRGRCSNTNNQCQVSNCDKCGSINECTQCSFGYFLNGVSCVSSCTFPLSAVNGVCKCATGILYQNACIISCPSGFTAISGTCQKCDSNCKQCSQQFNYCTACNTNYQLNVGSKQCQLINNVNCPYGQYFQNGACNKYCSGSLLYQNGLCYYDCLTNYVSNGQGGCVLQSNSNGCPTGKYLLNSNCVSQCPTGFFANAVSSKCQSCSSNCNRCSSSNVCLTCASSYNLNSQNACVLQQNSCPSGQFLLGTNCFSTCPVNYFANRISGKCQSCPQNCNTCSSAQICTSCNSNYVLNSDGSCGVKSTLCSSNLFELNGFCFNVCPSGFYPNRATQKCQKCPSTCSECSSSTVCTACISPNTLKSGVCSISNDSNNGQRNCTQGYYLNTIQNLCYPCKSPCSTCSSDTACLSCVPGFTLNGRQCISANCLDGYYKDPNNYCQACQSPCQTCSSVSVCITCVSGFQLNGNLCQAIQNNGNLIQLSGINVDSRRIRGNSVIIGLTLPVIPSGLTQDQKSKFFTVRQFNKVNTIVSVTQWILDGVPNRVFVMVNYDSIDGSEFLFLNVNSKVMSGAYANLGYFINDKAYKAVNVFKDMQVADPSFTIPISAVAVQYAVLVG